MKKAQFGLGFVMPGSGLARAGIAGACLLSLGGCAWLAQLRGEDDVAAQAAMVQSAATSCKYEVADASAWVNRMPGPGRDGARPVIVSAQLTDADAKVVLLKSDRSDAKTLVLEVRASEIAPIPGRMAYREPAPDPVYERVEIMCDGGLLHVVESVERVY